MASNKLLKIKCAEMCQERPSCEKEAQKTARRNGAERKQPVLFIWMSVPCGYKLDSLLCGIKIKTE